MLFARPRGGTERIAAIVDALNAAHLDWMFEARVVADELLQLQANWFGDFRTAAGFVVSDGTGAAASSGATLQLEDSPRMSGWLERQVEKADAACRAELDAFARSDRAAGDR